MDEIAAPLKKRLATSYMVMQEVNHQLFTDSVEEEIVLGVREPSEDPETACGDWGGCILR